MGLAMRQQAVAAVQAKALRLSGAAVADQAAGKARRPAGGRAGRRGLAPPSSGRSGAASSA